MTNRPTPSTVVVGVATLGVLVVAWFDYATGVELRVFPLYFLPVLAVSLRLGRWPGIGAAVVCAAAWMLSNHFAATSDVDPTIGIANLLMMAIAFGSIAILGAAQRAWLQREQALSRTDGLTGLLNARGFYEAAAAEFARTTRYPHPLSLAFVDLDSFKAINDRLGHARGDEVLVAVAKALRGACRSTDLVGRLGGDEFALLFPETGRDAAVAALQKVRASLEVTSIEVGSKVTASIGSVSFAVPPGDVGVLVRQADEPMYAVKAGGKDGLRCTDSVSA